MNWENIAGGQNWDQSYAGAGPIEDFTQAAKSISDGDWISVVANATVGGLSLMDAFDNPTKAIGTSVVGWLLEHIGFLDAFLDKTAGDANAVQAAYQKFYQAAQKVDGIAASQITAFGTRIDTYRRGVTPSAQAFEKRVSPRGDQLKTLSLQCYGLGEAITKAGALIGACRGVMRDLLAEFTWLVFQKAQVALAMAPYTAGGSLATLATETCISAASLARDLAGKLSWMAKDLFELRELVKELFKAFVNTLSPILVANGMPSATKLRYDSAAAYPLSAADDAEQQVAQQDADEEAARKAKVHPTGPPPPLYPMDPPPPQKEQGPGLNAKWTASGSLDE